MEKYINDFGKECWRGVSRDTDLDRHLFHKGSAIEDDTQLCFFSNIGNITILDRMTGFGWRDIETGFRDPDGYFWLASGGCDVLNAGLSTVGDAIDWIKKNANTCVALPPLEATK